MSNAIPVYCINLKRAIERKAFIEEEWVRKRSVKIMFSEGYDVQSADIQKLPEPYNTNLKNTDKELKELIWPNQTLKFSAICCSISHCETLRKILASNAEEAIIIEDDAVPLFDTAEELYDRIEACKSEMRGINVLFLHQPLENGRKFIVKENKQTIRVLEQATTCAQAIYYNKQGMIDTLRDASRLLVPMDWTWDINIIKSHSLGLINTPITRHPPHGTTYINSAGHRLFVETNIHESILQQFCDYQKPHQVIAPFYNASGLSVEQHFLKFYRNNIELFKQTNWVYVPVCWTDLYAGRHEQKVYEKLQSLLIKLRDVIGIQFFTITQYKDGIEQWLPPNITVFSMDYKSSHTISIPSICKNTIMDSAVYKHTTSNNTKDIFCSCSIPQGDKFFKCLTDNVKVKFVPKSNNLNFSHVEQERYVNTILRSKYTLHREIDDSIDYGLYESMCLGTVPVYVYDTNRLPFQEEVDWTKICVLVHKTEIDKIESILDAISIDQYELFLKNIKQIYATFFTLDGCFTKILTKLQHTQSLQVDCIDPISDKSTNNVSRFSFSSPVNKNGIDVTPLNTIYTSLPHSHKMPLAWENNIKCLYPNVNIIPIITKLPKNAERFDEDSIIKILASRVSGMTTLLSNTNGELFIYCDTIISPIHEFHSVVNHLLLEKDILFISGSEFKQSINFFVCRRTEIVRRLFSKALWLLRNKSHIITSDEHAMDEALKRITDIKYALMPSSIFELDQGN